MSVGASLTSRCAGGGTFCTNGCCPLATGHHITNAGSQPLSNTIAHRLQRRKPPISAHRKASPTVRSLLPANIPPFAKRLATTAQ
jgi:hypothetical protein